MRYHNITKNDMLNGEGIRTVLWVSGCEHACKGCHNPTTWNPRSGLKFDKKAKQELFSAVAEPHCQGLTLSGGDPLATYNREDTLSLLKKFHKKFPSKDVWLYTGYLLKDLLGLEVLDYIHVLVEGRFEQSLSSEKIPWVGSSNQKVIRQKRA